MKAIFIAATAIFGLVSSVYAAGPITPRQALGSAGQNVVVEGTVSGIYPDPMQAGVDLEVTAQDSHIIGFIPEGSESAFADIKAYAGKTVDLTGVVQTSDGRAEIRITSERQLSPAQAG